MESFLQSYKVQDKPSALSSAKRKERKTGEAGIVSDDTKRIGAYMERLEKLFLNPDTDKRKHAIEIFKRKFLYSVALIKPKDFPESYFAFQKQQAQERGMEEVSFSDQEKQVEIYKVIESQRLSLNAWIEYLSGDDCKYPVDIKYFAMQGVLQSGNFDTEKYSFSTRDKKTTGSFPEIDREALSKVLGALDAVHHNLDTAGYPPALLKLVQEGVSFAKMYGETMKILDQTANKEELLPHYRWHLARVPPGGRSKGISGKSFRHAQQPLPRRHRFCHPLSRNRFCGSVFFL